MCKDKALKFFRENIGDYRQSLGVGKDFDNTHYDSHKG